MLYSNLDNKISVLQPNASIGTIELFSDTPFIDFHFQNSGADYTSRIIEFASGTLTCQANFEVTGNIKSGGQNISLANHTHADITNRINVISKSGLSGTIGAINTYSDYNHWVGFHYTSPFTNATVPRIVIDGTSIYDLVCWGKSRSEDNPSAFVLHSMFLDTSNRLILLGSQNGQLVRRAVSTTSYTP